MVGFTPLSVTEGGAVPPLRARGQRRRRRAGRSGACRELWSRRAEAVGRVAALRRLLLPLPSQRSPAPSLSLLLPRPQPSVPCPHPSGSSAATAEDSEPSRWGGGGSWSLRAIRHLTGHGRRSESVASVAFREDKGIAASAAAAAVFACSGSPVRRYTPTLPRSALAEPGPVVLGRMGMGAADPLAGWGKGVKVAMERRAGKGDLSRRGLGVGWGWDTSRLRGERRSEGTFNGDDLGQEHGIVGLGWNLDGFGRNGWWNWSGMAFNGGGDWMRVVDLGLAWSNWQLGIWAGLRAKGLISIESATAELDRTLGGG